MKRNIIIVSIIIAIVALTGAGAWYYLKTTGTADEPAPMAQTREASTEKPADKTTQKPAAAQPATERSGNFSPRNNEIISGSVSLIGDTIRLNGDFSTENGPDLFLFTGTADSRTTQIAPLKAASGAQNYQLPANTDPDSITHIWIYCRAFDLDFGVAALR